MAIRCVPAMRGDMLYAHTSTPAMSATMGTDV
jgi:hypothetical protein